MKNEDIIEVLKRIDNLLLFDKKFEAREYIKLEIENLKGIVSKECKKYNFCNECSNMNCIRKNKTP